MFDADPCVRADLIVELYRRAKDFVLRRRIDIGRPNKTQFHLGDEFTAMLNPQEAVILRMKEWPYARVFACLSTGRVVDCEEFLLSELLDLLRGYQLLDDIANV